MHGPLNVSFNFGIHAENRRIVSFHVKCLLALCDVLLSYCSDYHIVAIAIREFPPFGIQKYPLSFTITLSHSANYYKFY